MTVLLSVAIVCAVLLFVAWRVERYVKAKAERELALKERQLAIEEAKVAKPKDETPIPTGLMMIAARETEEWAKEQIKGRMRELYAECKDWNVVGQLIAQEAHGTFGEIDA